MGPQGHLRLHRYSTNRNYRDNECRKGVEVNSSAKRSNSRVFPDGMQGLVECTVEVARPNNEVLPKIRTTH
jgi:hypothetical protein